MSEIQELIRIEHTAIKKYLGLILSSDRIDYRKAIDFCKNIIELNHHYKEETTIFKNLENKPALSAGGPYCMLYFDDHMRNAPFNIVKDLKKRFHIELNESISPHLESLFSKKTPLNIPIEDHQAGKFLINMAETLLSQEMDRTADLKLVFDSYLRLQDSHFEREENCFLKMFESLTTASEKKEILHQLQNEATPFINENYIEKYLNAQ